MKSQVLRFQRFLRKSPNEKRLALKFHSKRLWVSLQASFSSFPIPIHLPYGGWYIAWNDVIGRHLRLREGFEEGEQSFLQSFLQPGMAVLDCGAHHGLYTLLASKKVGPKGEVVAFEPSPRERWKLYWHVKMNRCPNVQIEPFALGSREGDARLFICLGQETGCNSLRPPAVSEPTKPIQVAVTTLDGYWERFRIDVPDFIKLDIEGAELEALKGAVRLLSHRSRPFLMCELADIRTEPWGYRSREIYEFLSTWGYRWFSITPAGRLRPCPKKDRFNQNLVAAPEEKIGLLGSVLEDYEEQSIALP